MIVKTTGLKFYETIAERDWTYRNIENHSDNVLILGNPWGIIPFQIITDRLIGLITVCNITNREGIITDLLPVGTYNILDYITIENDTFLYWVIFDGIVDQEIDDGVYDLEIGDGTQTFYSEVFKVSCECELIYRDKYGNNEDAIFDSESEFSSRIANIAKFIDNPVFYPPIGADTIWDRGFTNTPYFCLNRDGSLFYDGDYYMYYGACNNVLQTDANPEDPGYNNDRVGLAKTKDFVNFTRVTGLSGDGDGCVITWGNGDRGDGVGHYGGNPTLLEGHGYHQGQHTGANNAPQLTCAGENWIVNQFIGLILVNRTDKCWGTITANGVNSITCAGGFAGGTDDDWDTNDFYDIACWDQYDTQLGCIINDGGTFRMWFTGNMNTDYKQYLPPAAYSDHMNLLYATSPDGEVWTKQIAPIIAYGAGGDDDDDGVYAPSVIWDEDDLEWKMWYIGKTGGQYGVMYATADNPEGVWTKHGTTWVFYEALLGAGLFSPTVRKLTDGTYLMVYCGINQPNNGLRYATSPDGINWTGQGTFLLPGGGGAWDEDVVMWSSYFVENGIFYLFYRGDNKVTTPGEGEAAGSVEIGFASIPINWKRCDRLALTWWNENDFCDVIYQTGYKNKLFFDAIMSKPENVIFEESQEDEEHNIFPTIQTQRKYYSFETGGSEAMFDMLGTLRLHDYIEITFKDGERQRIFDVKLETTWQDENLCMFKISFFAENCTTAGCEDNFVLQENLAPNNRFDNWTGDTPDNWTVVGEAGADPEISEVALNQGHGGAGTGACNIFTTGVAISMRPTIDILTIGKIYLIEIEITKLISGTIYFTVGSNGKNIQVTTEGINRFVQICDGTDGRFRIIRSNVPCDVTIDNVKVIQLD